jgi:hypothetical protein
VVDSVAVAVAKSLGGKSLTVALDVGQARLGGWTATTEDMPFLGRKLPGALFQRKVMVLRSLRYHACYWRNVA